MPIPVILDTDLGLDVDDVWALAFLLRCPELDLRLVVSDTGDTTYRAALAAKVLAAAGRTDVPIGVGIPLDDADHTHATWLDGYDLDDYPGEVLTDGVGALCETIMASAEPVTVIAIGPVPNLAAALAREPRIVENSRFVGMHGSIRLGYADIPKPMREFNVKMHALACRQVFASPWERTITPLDTCGNVYLDGQRFERVAASTDPLMQAVMGNHEGWREATRDWPMLQDLDLERRSSILFDTVAVWLAFAEDLVEIETLPLTVTPDGKTLIDEANGQPTRCATRWRDKEAFLDLLVERLVG